MFVRFDRGARSSAAPDEPRRSVDVLAGFGAFVTFFGILMISIVGVDVLGNRPVYFLVGDVTPAIAVVVFLVGVGLLWSSRPRTAAPSPT